MNINEIKDLKDQLEADITFFVSNEVEKFKNKTKISPCSIDISMIKTHGINKFDNYFVDNCKIDIVI